MKRKDLRNEAVTVSEQFSGRVRKLQEQEKALTDELQELVRQRPGVRIAERLAKTTLAEVDRPGQSIRSASLRSAGLVTLLDAHRYRGSLERLPNVGSVTAQRIRAIVNKVAAQTPEDSRFYSDPSTWNANDLAFVRTLVQLERIRQAKNSTDAFEKSLELSRIANQLRTKTGAVSFLSRSTREDAHALYQRIQEIAPASERQSLESDLDRISAAGSPEVAQKALSDDEVIREWRTNSAGLLALVDEVSPGAVGARQPGGSPEEVSADRLAAGAPQLLPSDIQERINNFQLNNRGFKRQLRTYQHFGARFVLSAEGAILGDEMGLGKTMQALAVAHHLAQEKDKVLVLVIAPVSILENWRREITEATHLTPFMLYGPGREHRTHEWEHDGGIALTSYQTLQRLPMSSDIALDLTIVDEAHKIKNPSAKQTEAAFDRLRRSRFRLLMSGTPLENRASEFIFLSWLANKSLGEHLATQFGDGSTAHLQAATFRKAVAPGYLRRNQSDVLQELPELLMNNEMVTLEHAEIEKYRESLRAGNHAAPRQSVSIGLGAASSKMTRLKELLEEYEEQGRKVLIFTSFLKALDTVIGVAGPGTLRMDGSVPTSARQGIVDEFTALPGYGVLAMQIEVGGVGLNVQAASVAIIIEPQWKPSTEWQAIGRAYRMGQTRRVNVHRLLAANTIDERIEERLQSKTRIFNAIVRPSHLVEEMEEATAGDLGEKGLMSIVAEEARRLHVEPGSATE